jgi:hypothetical protein
MVVVLAALAVGLAALRDDAVAGRSRSSRLGRARSANAGLGSDRHARQRHQKDIATSLLRGMQARY